MDLFEERNLFARVHKLEEEMEKMAIDLTKIQADEATLKTAVEQLIAGFTAQQAQIAALEAGAVTQSQIDALDKTNNDTLAEVQATLTPPGGSPPAIKKK